MKTFKKSILVLMAVMAVSLTSCKKERTCKFTTTVNGETTTETYPMGKAKKADQEVACDVFTLGGTTTTCTLED